MERPKLKKKREVLDERTAKRFWERAVYVAKQRGGFECAEDFAQDLLERFYSGKSQHQTIDQAFIDYSRRTGRSSRPDKPFSARYQESSGYSVDDLSPREIPREYQKHDFEINELIDCLSNPTERAFICLRFIWGFDEKEIGDCFGVTESRVSQKLRSILESLSCRMAAKEQTQARIEAALEEKRSESEGRGKERMEALLSKKGEAMEFFAHFSVAKEESESLAFTHEASFDQWLT